MNVTYPTALVLQALAHGSRYGFDVMDATGLASGTVYPILRRIEREGLVRAHWENAGIAQREQRPPRRYYELTAEGEALLEAALQRYRQPAAIAARARRLGPARS
jgi:PadR family transcriptional regulator, regulatory protein PadR